MKTNPLIAPRGFSLLELLAVLTLMLILMALAGAALSHSGKSLGLSTTSVQVQGLLDEGRQLAITGNNYVQVRFLRRSGEADFEAIALFSADSPFYGSAADYDTWIAQGRLRPHGRVLHLPASACLPDTADTAGLLQALASDTAFPRSGTMSAGGRSYDWVGFYFRPNGVPDFQMIKGSPFPAREAFFSLATRSDYAGSQPKLPANYTAFLITPSSGRTMTFRP